MLSRFNIMMQITYKMEYTDNFLGVRVCVCACVCVKEIRHYQMGSKEIGTIKWEFKEIRHHQMGSLRNKALSNGEFKEIGTIKWRV